MKHIKKIAALVLAFAMVLSLSSVAFAAETPNTTGNSYTDDSQTTVSGTSIPMTKSIVFFNLNGSNVYEPNITYTYSVAPVTADAELGSVTDDGEYNSNVSVTVQVNAGVPDGVIFEGTANTITYSSEHDAVAAAEKGVEVEYKTNLTVDLSKFTHAGIYRYKVTEADNASAVTAAGMVRGSNYSSERYLDVYIANDTTTDPATLKLSGAVFFKTDAKDNDSNNATDKITTTTEKTTGFDPKPTDDGSGNLDYTSDTFADHYTTYDIEVKKVITGSMADKTHNFPFFINITNTITGAKYTYTNDAGSATAETIAGAAIVKGTDAENSAIALKDGESVKFVGVPSNQTNALTIAVKEFNDTVDFYSASVKATKGTVSVKMDNSDAATQMAANTGYAVVADFNVKTNDIAAQIIEVTNNLSEISPTGYVVRIAPYVLMLAGGVALLIVTRRRREDSQAA